MSIANLAFFDLNNALASLSKNRAQRASEAEDIGGNITIVNNSPEIAIFI